MSTLRHILVATDFSPTSNRALERAVDLAARFDAKLTVLHVLEPPPYPYAVPGAVPLPTIPMDSIRPRRLEELERTVSSIRARWGKAQSLLRDGSPWREIVSAATEVGAELIVVGSHGRHGLPRWMLGSVAEKVVRTSPVPVLTVHPYVFANRQDAGRSLADSLSALRSDNPAVLAISRGGVVVGAEVARALGVSVDVLLTDALVTSGVTLGAICEEGTTRLDARAVQAALSLEEREKLVSNARTELNALSLRLRGSRGIEEVWRRTVILVTDVLVEPWTARVAAEVVGRMQPDRLIVAAPVASEGTLNALRSDFETVTVETWKDEQDASNAYADFAEPLDRDVVELLRVPSNAA